MRNTIILHPETTVGSIPPDAQFQGMAKSIAETQQIGRELVTFNETCA